jgi:hypothetical protein
MPTKPKAVPAASSTGVNDFVAGGLAGTVDSELSEVWLDGVREPLAIRASSRWGFIERYKTDPAGEIMHDPAGEAIKERVFGKVKIRPCN